MANTLKPKKWVILRGLVRGSYHWSGFDHLMKEQLSLETVVTPDLAGNGYRNTEYSPTSLVKAVEDIRTQVKKQVRLEEGETIAALGVSLGGMIVSKWIELYPEEISHLVLINTSSNRSPFFKRIVPANYFKIAKLVFSYNSHEIENFILSQCCNNEATKIKYLSDFVKKNQEYPTKSINLLRQLLMAAQANFKKPNNDNVLFLLSEKDRLVSSACTEKIAKQWGQQIVTNPRSGHDMTLDDPNWVVDKIFERFYK